MKIVVQKFGGSSVKDIKSLKYVIEKIKIKIEEGYKVLVVVSAQGKTTDKLIKLAKEYGCKEKTKELDLLMSTGEVISASLLTMLLKENGIDAVTYSANNLGIVTNSDFGKAEVENVYPEKILKDLEKNVVVATGFQGLDKFGNVTTLGRGGSDYSAVVLARAVKAERCEIYSDIDGIYTADPRVIQKAKLLSKISVREMLEFAEAGAKVLEKKSVREFKKFNGKLFVKNTKGKKEGTEVVKDTLEEKFASKDNLSKITLIGDGYISNLKKLKEILSVIEELNIRIYMLEVLETVVNIVIDSENKEEVITKLHEKFNE